MLRKRRRISESVDDDPMSGINNQYRMAGSVYRTVCAVAKPLGHAHAATPQFRDFCLALHGVVNANRKSKVHIDMH